MKKLLTRIVMVLAMLLLLNWVYSKWFFEKDLRKHSDIVELSWQVTDDSCRIIYVGESSNSNYGKDEVNHQKISDITAEYFPNVKMGDMTHAASHAQTYYYMLKHVPANSAVETAIVTMNLRSFGPNWIYSKLETALRKQLVLLEDYPPLVNRFVLAFKAYPIKTQEEWVDLIYWHRRHDPLSFPYDFPFDNNYAWDSAVGWHGVRDEMGRRDQGMTELTCHYIKAYGFTITDENPRVKDFDAIVELCRERGWNLVFNLMAENVDKANELVGKDLLFLIKRNRDYLLNRYGNMEGVEVVNNLSLVRDVNFIDQNWTTEHYYEEGRRLVAKQVAQGLRKYYPSDYQEVEIIFDTGHYRFAGQERELNVKRPFGNALVLTADSIHPEWQKVNVAFMMKQADSLHNTKLVIEKHDAIGKATFESYPTWPQNVTLGRWEFVTFAVPLDLDFHTSQMIKIYVANHSESSVQIKDFDVSFRPAYLAPSVKAQSSQQAQQE